MKKRFFIHFHGGGSMGIPVSREPRTAGFYGFVRRVIRTKARALRDGKNKTPSSSLGFFALSCLLVAIFLASAFATHEAFKLKTALENKAKLAGKAMLDATRQSANGEFGFASENFEKAGMIFTDARIELNRQSESLLGIPALLPQVRAAGKLFDAAILASQAGQDFTSAMHSAKDVKVSAAGLSISGQTLPISDLAGQADTAMIRLQQAAKLVREASGWGLGRQLRSGLRTAQEQAGELQAALGPTRDALSLTAGILEGRKNILVFFANNNELRPVGGFLGSYAAIKVNDGSIQKVEVSSIYDLDGQLKEKYRPPYPVLAVNDRWFLRDANWLADYRQSAAIMADFYEREGGETPDVMLTITPQTMAGIMQILGPVNMPKYDLELNSDNFLELTQVATSINYNRYENRPKQLLADLVPVLLQRISQASSAQWPKLLLSLQNSLQNKHAVIYSRSEQIQSLAESFNWAGRLSATDRDYLSVVSANLNGSKTDLFIRQEIDLVSKVQDDGAIVNRLTLARKNAMPDLPNTANSSYIRILVPEGSQLLSSEGFDPPAQVPVSGTDRKPHPAVTEWEAGITRDLSTGISVGREGGKTFFGNWLTVRGGESRKVSVTYKLPYKLNKMDRHSLLVQKQVGAQTAKFSYRLELADWSILWQNWGSAAVLMNGSATLTSPFDRDVLLASVLAK